jgi:hypothetical protein
MIIRGLIEVWSQFVTCVGCPDATLTEGDPASTTVIETTATNLVTA